VPQSRASDGRLPSVGSLFGEQTTRVRRGRVRREPRSCRARDSPLQPPCHSPDPLRPFEGLCMRSVPAGPSPASGRPRASKHQKFSKSLSGPATDCNRRDCTICFALAVLPPPAAGCTYSPAVQRQAAQPLGDVLDSKFARSAGSRRDGSVLCV